MGSPALTPGLTYIKAPPIFLTACHLLKLMAEVSFLFIMNLVLLIFLKLKNFLEKAVFCVFLCVYCIFCVAVCLCIFQKWN